MSKPCKKLFLYRSGLRHAELFLPKTKAHGVLRSWHHNGRLAEALRYRNGMMHGVSRQWDREGQLLGSFEMKHGTGVQKYFHENGQPKQEITTVNGQFHGRTRMWMRDGTLTFEKYSIFDRDVPRSTYLKAAASHPDWPQYAGQPRGHVMREGKSQTRKQTELFFESILQQSHEEALAWLKDEVGTRTLGEFRSTRSALKFVESLYRAGAKCILAGPIYGNKKRQFFADWLFIELPQNKSARQLLRSICDQHIRKHGGAYLPEKDIQEKHLCLNIAP